MGYDWMDGEGDEPCVYGSPIFLLIVIHYSCATGRKYGYY
jgi:hypothetical protein